MIKDIDKLKQAIDDSQDILIVQADNPDGDSLGSALALEQIFHDMGKTPHLYCGVSIPDYLKFLPGWDRVEKEIPNKIDATIIVDTSAHTLLEQLEKCRSLPLIASKPVIVLDHHHSVECDIPYASIVYNLPNYVATGELIYDIATQLNWPINSDSLMPLMQSILSDSMGLVTDGTTSETYRRLANMIDYGVDRTRLEEARRQLSKMPISVFRYKAKLIERAEFFGDNNQLAIVEIPESELFDVGTLYNPAPLILGELTMVEDISVAIALKVYKNKVTAAIRCTGDRGIANKLAECYGGGGHAYAAGFKIESKSIDIKKLKNEIISKAIELLK